MLEREGDAITLDFEITQDHLRRAPASHNPHLWVVNSGIEGFIETVLKMSGLIWIERTLRVVGRVMPPVVKASIYVEVLEKSLDGLTIRVRCFVDGRAIIEGALLAQFTALAPSAETIAAAESAELLDAFVAAREPTNGRIAIETSNQELCGIIDAMGEDWSICATERR